MSYSNGFTALYRFADFTFDTGDEVFLTGPAGLLGRLIDISTVITTATTDTVTIIDVGTQGNDDAYGVHTVPIGAAEVITNGFVRGVDDVIAADSVVTVLGNGGATAGDGDILILIEWY